MIYQYTPILAPAGGGHICLTIYGPGAWMESPGYHVFMGGCGVGQAKTLPLAEAILRDAITNELARRAMDAVLVAAHYEGERQRLLATGLTIVATFAPPDSTVI